MANELFIYNWIKKKNEIIRKQSVCSDKRKQGVSLFSVSITNYFSVSPAWPRTDSDVYVCTNTSGTLINLTITERDNNAVGIPMITHFRPSICKCPCLCLRTYKTRLMSVCHESVHRFW